ncbi:hypothetical protein EVAR_83728_1 [Eumeta japonica]|uniref:Uncharacterized protein n=1 Tax=Eumeta variegata TaxID=151549 RepID=A0A4C1W9F3_EUMVA|nr:hypothetical protein EVAR_83728_1 [Eumeta japonica]
MVVTGPLQVRGYRRASWSACAPGIKCALIPLRVYENRERTPARGRQTGQKNWYTLDGIQIRKELFNYLSLKYNLKGSKGGGQA